MGIKKKKIKHESKTQITRDDVLFYDSVFGTNRGFTYLEPSGMIVYDPALDKTYFCLSEDREIFIDRVERSLVAGENLFSKEWREWEGYKEGDLY